MRVQHDSVWKTVSRLADVRWRTPIAGNIKKEAAVLFRLYMLHI